MLDSIMVQPMFIQVFHMYLSK